MTHPWNRRSVLSALGGAAALAALPGARAAAYPTKPIKLLVGSPPGGPSDFLARVYSEAMGPLLGQSLLVENKPGASGTLAADVAAKSPPDGHTLLITGPASITSAPHLFKLNYEPSVDFVPVHMLGAGAFVLAVHPSLPVKNVAELIALAKAKPGSIPYGSGGNGSSGHLCTELFSQQAGIKMFHVPYKGDGQALTDLLAGQIQVMFTAPNVVMPQVKAGKLRLLAVTTRERVPSMPDAPTVSESGVKDFEYLGWIIVFAPSATPKPVLEQLGTAWGKVRGASSVRGRLEELAMAAPDRLAAGEGLAQFVKGESARLARLIREVGIKVD